MRRLNRIRQLMPVGALGGGGIRYLLRDEFTTDLAAGAVNTTLTSDGKAARVVVDTENKLSLSGGEVLLSKKAAAAYGDPALWIDYGIAREAGRVLTSHFRATVSGTLVIGWDSDQLTFPGAHAFLVSGTDLRNFDYGGGGNVGTITIGQDYYITVVLREGGAHYFIRGGTEYPENTLVYSRNTGAASTPLYPTICGNSASFSCGYLRIPDTLWLPSPVASDAFTRADGAIGSTDGAGHLETTGLGAGGNGLTWTNQQGTIAIATNKAQASALNAGGVAIATVDTGKADVNIDLTVTRAGDVSGAVLRYVDIDNYIYAGFDGTNWNLTKRVAGVETVVKTAVAIIGAGTLRVQAHGSSFYMYRNTTLVDSVATIGDAALQTSTKHGLYSSNIGNTADNFAVWSRT